MNGRAVYLDTSAFMKLVMPEPESAALRLHLRGWPSRVSASLLVTEALRAALQASPVRIAAVRHQLRGIVLINLDRTLLENAGMLGPPTMRSLDAVHIATALSLGAEVEAMVTYDDRMAAAARAQGLAVADPR